MLENQEETILSLLWGKNYKNKNLCTEIPYWVIEKVVEISKVKWKLENHEPQNILPSFREI